LEFYEVHKRFLRWTLFTQHVNDVWWYGIAKIHVSSIVDVGGGSQIYPDFCQYETNDPILLSELAYSDLDFGNGSLCSKNKKLYYAFKQTNK
jgi:hypothetical protein